MDEEQYIIKMIENVSAKFPQPFNVSTLLFDYGDGFQVVGEQPVIVRSVPTKFDIQFTIEREQSVQPKGMRWYVLKGRILRFKISLFEYLTDGDVKYTIAQDVLCNEWPIVQNGYFAPVAFDPMLTVPVERDIRAVHITGEWFIVEDSQAYLETANTMLTEQAKRLEKTNRQVDDLRDTNKTLHEMISQQNDRIAYYEGRFLGGWAKKKYGAQSEKSCKRNWRRRITDDNNV